MRLAVFGATGPTGALLVQWALDQGHDVTAYARNPAKLTTSHPRLSVIQGELTDTTSIAHAVDGTDAVLSVLGP